jgi:hypothetical protein
MRLVRVAELAESGAWYSSRMPRSNTPYGEELHWTRPFDVLLLAGGSAFGLGGGLDFGLRLWSLLFGPLLHLATVLALIWSVRPLLDRQTQFLMALMALFQASVFYQFLPGRVDHHGLLAFLFVVLTGLGIRIIGAPEARRPAIVAGALAALAVWLSVEGGLAIAVALAAIVIVWLTRPAEGAVAGLRFSASAALGLALAIAIERPPAEWLADEYDRISIVHLWAFVSSALFWLCLHLWFRHGREPPLTARLSLLGLGVVVGGAAMWAGYPKFFAGPMAEVAPAIKALWFQRVTEVMSPVAQPGLGHTIHLLCLYLGAVLPALLYLPALIRHIEGVRRRCWLLLALTLVAATALGLYQLRWSTYAQLAAMPAYAVLLSRTLALLGLSLTGDTVVPRSIARLLAPAFGRVIVLLAFGFGFIAFGWLFKPGGEAAATETAAQIVRACDLRSISRHLDDSSIHGNRSRRILTYIFDGPEILYRTRHQVVGTPYHRNDAGMLDTYAFFSAAEDATARRIAAKRGIELVLLCPSGSERLFYTGGEAEILLDRLARDAAPAWLKPLPLPPALASQYRLFEVRLR